MTKPSLEGSSGVGRAPSGRGRPQPGPPRAHRAQALVQPGPRPRLELAGEQGVRVIEGLKDVAPDLARYVVEFGYGDVYSRAGLDLRQRQLVAIAALTALGGCEPQLEYHIGIALNVGVARGEIVETI